jgi:hypothetical protein
VEFSRAGGNNCHVMRAATSFALEIAVQFSPRNELSSSALKIAVQKKPSCTWEMTHLQLYNLPSVHIDRLFSWARKYEETDNTSRWFSRLGNLGALLLGLFHGRQIVKI